MNDIYVEEIINRMPKESLVRRLYNDEISSLKSDLSLVYRHKILNRMNDIKKDLLKRKKL